MKKTFALVFLLAAFALFAIACGDDDDGPTVTPTPSDSPATPTPTEPTSTPTTPAEPTATPTPPSEGEAPEGLYGHGKRTGIAHIDAILQVWENGEISALVALALLQDQECVVEQQGLGGPPKCPPGVQDGSTVKVMPASQCEGFWVYEDGLAALFQSFVDGIDGQEYYLYAAWRSDGDEHNPAGYRIQFARTLEGYDVFSPQVMLDEDGKIANYRGGCLPAPQMVPAGADYVLGPKGGAGSLTGIPAADLFLDVRQQGNVNAMGNLVSFFDVACKLPSEVTYYIHCPEGQPSGTPVQAFPWWGCHGAFSNVGTPQQVAEFFTTFEGQVHSVIRFTPAGSVDMFPAQAALAVILDRADGFAWAAVLDDDGNFYGMVSGCPATPNELLELHFNGAEVLFKAV